MTTPLERLAIALEKMRTVQVDGIVRSHQLSRENLRRLTKVGFLQPVIRGWYYVTNPRLEAGSTAWYSCYWSFLRQYLGERFGEDYCLLPEASLKILTGSTLVPRQIAVARRGAGQQILSLPEGVSLLIYQDKANFPSAIVEVDGLRVMALHEALTRVPESFYRDCEQEAVIALRILQDPAPLIRTLLEQGKSYVAGRLAGAFRHLGDFTSAERIAQTFKSAGYEVRETNPFAQKAMEPIEAIRSSSPYEARLQALWASMRLAVLEVFSPSPGGLQSMEEALARIDEHYVQDAYHSLSIEGYQVSPTLIEKVRGGRWNPQANLDDQDTMNALAARGYLAAFEAVKESVKRILKGQSAARVARHEHHGWYQALFSSSVQAGLIEASVLAGYRSTPVYIRGSRHVPFPAHAVSEAMRALFDLIEQEESPVVQGVLGHFLFGFIHPYPDGNGRMARLLMNAFLVSGGYGWTIVHLENRARYMGALEEASVNHDIVPFARCLYEEMLRTGEE